jgi:hypothetical protein
MTEPFTGIESKTFKVLTGCGNIYITADLKNNVLHKIRMQRTSKLHCSPTVLNSLFRSVTFETRRDISQAIKDHKGSEDDVCEKFNITIKAQMRGGILAAYSCTDAIARVLEKIVEENGKLNGIPEKKV